MTHSSITSRLAYRAVLIFIVIGLPLRSANAEDMMELCAEAIETHCQTVEIGRGRVTACLYSHIEKLQPSCRQEVTRITKGTVLDIAGAEGDDPAITDDVRKMRAVCDADVSRHCPNVSANDQRQLACLYAKSNDVSQVCNVAMKDVLSQL